MHASNHIVTVFTHSGLAHFIEFVLEETNQLFSGNSNVILTRQTCGQCGSGMAAAERYFWVFQGRAASGG